MTIHQEFAMSKYASQQDRDAAILKALEAERAKRAADNAQYAADEIEWNGLIAAEREKVKELEVSVWEQKRCQDGLETSLAAAQATIVQMREALTEVVDADECQDADGWLCFELSAEAYHRADAALSIPANLDQLHEDRARECERLADWRVHNRCTYTEKESAAWLREEAAAHRAKKGEGK